MDQPDSTIGENRLAKKLDKAADYLDLSEFYAKPKERTLKGDIGMSKSLGLILGVVAVICIVLLVQVVLLHTDREKIKMALSLAEQRATEADQGRKTAEAGLAELKLQREVLQRQMTDLQASADALTVQLTEERTKGEALAGQVAEKEQQLAQMQETIRQKQRENDQLTSEIDRQKDQLSRYTRLLEEVKGNSAMLEGRVEKLSADRGMPLDKIVIKPLSEKAEVLVVNKRYNFIVTNIGADRGVQPGMFINVSRDGKFIGRVQIERVNERFCAATILPEWQVSDIREGDNVLLEASAEPGTQPAPVPEEESDDLSPDQKDIYRPQRLDELDIERLLSQ